MTHHVRVHQSVLAAAGYVRLFDVGGVIATAGLAGALAVAVGRNVVSLARLER